MNTPLRLLFDGEAARLLCMPRLRLLRLVKDGKVPCVLLPDGEVRFIEADLLKWIDNCKIKEVTP